MGTEIISDRQGDILLVKLDQIDEPVVNENDRDGRKIIAYGEATGHHHELQPDPSKPGASVQILVNPESKNRYLLVKEGGQIVHEEHATTLLDEGAYRIMPQREFVKMDQTRRVYD